MKKPTFLIIELIILFIMMPLLLVLNVHPIFKVTILFLGLIYCIYTTVKQKLLPLKSLYTINYRHHWKSIAIKVVIMMVGSTLLMYFYNYELLFIVVKKNWVLWILVTLFYSIFSVYPQEFLYRAFFFNRYHTILNTPTLLIVVNAAIFSFAHIAFHNTLVTILTLAGGFLFAITYHKSKSLMLTSIEHAIYGSWLFTLGMGEMLAFPMPN